MNNDIARAITHAAEQMHRASTTDEALELIVRTAVETLPTFEHIGVSTVEKGGAIVNRAASSDLVYELDQLQYSLPEGPCVDSIAGEEVVVAPSIQHTQKWPRYVPTAIEHGLRSQMAVRLHLADQGTIGGLNLYSTTSEEIADGDVATAAYFATHAAIALGRATQSESLGNAIETRQLIGQAIGILMERYTITEKAAHAFLWRASSHSNTKVRDLALNLITDAAPAEERPTGGLS